MKCLVCGFERTPTHVDERPCWCEPSRAYVDRLYDEIARLRTVLVTPRAIGSALQRAEQAEARLARVVEAGQAIYNALRHTNAKDAPVEILREWRDATLAVKEEP